MPAFMKLSFLSIVTILAAALLLGGSLLKAQTWSKDRLEQEEQQEEEKESEKTTTTMEDRRAAYEKRRQEMREARAERRKKTAFQVNGSIFFPNYIAQGTVYTRGVANMPVLKNSAEIGKYMKEMPSKHNDKNVTTSLNATFFNLPVYIVDSRDPKTPRARVKVPDFRNHMVTPRMREILFNDNIPIPDWAKAANPQRAGDSAMAIYDIGTGIIREYFFIIKDAERDWTASYGGYYENMFNLAETNYACQHTEGSDFVTMMIGAPGQIGIEEARRGEINHAVCFTMANARKGLISWPAKQSDGTDENPLAPAQGQWFRLPPDLDIDAMNLKPMTKLIAKAVQKYGGFGSDKNLFCHAFNAEPGFVEEHLTGQDPWKPGGDLHEKYQLHNNLLNDFPWELTEWAPPSWGQPTSGNNQRRR